MTSRVRLNFWLDEPQRAALLRIKARVGVPESEQLRRAVDLWLREQGEVVKTERPRAATRKRS